MIDHKDRFIGSLLGTCIGDILGAPVEGYSGDEISASFGQVDRFIPSSRGYGCYTDDTQMTIALALSIIRCGEVDPEDCARSYAQLYESGRGYGWGASLILKSLKKGADYRQTGRSQFRQGSFANGGAMRIAPVGLVYRDKEDNDLRRAVYNAIMCTHVHPEGIDGAVLQASAVGLMTKIEDKHRFDPEVFLKVLFNVAQTEVFKTRIKALEEILDLSIPDRDAISILGNGVKASQSVPCALLATIRYYKRPEDAIIKAVGFGGDTDTIGAMTGAQIGALHGSGWIPAHWFDNIENNKYGRDDIINIAGRLSDITV
ncbi:MAG: ADP-ribosylglycohydrolase family protein [Deltaproteobacteria bacterium]|nr:ADP-ribosylglycohydrolase family protein [Deltaproteobacteria bacterium]